MRRADRLFQIIQVLRRSRAPITAEAIALELETSKRTIYRDIADLVGQRAPIRGEAGVGYVLEGGFDMPPLMLTPEEVEAAVLGAQFVAQRGDAGLARAAEDLLAKIHTVIPERLRPLVVEPSIRAGPTRKGAVDGLDMTAVRAAIRGARKLRLSYSDEQGRPSLRTVWPFGVGYFETTRLLLAWCELRSDFRSFRTDRVLAADFLDEPYPERPARLRAQWTKLQAQRRAEREAAGGCGGEGRDPR